MEAHEITKELLTQHQRVIFNGNGYSEEWVAEAERRGLPNLHSMVDAIPTLTTDKAVKMFEKFGVYTCNIRYCEETDCSSSYEIPEKTCKWRC